MPRKAIDLAGLKFGRLTGIRPSGRKIGKSIVWEWSCDCGNRHEAIGSSVSAGAIQSCGCIRKESRVISVGDRFGRLVATRKTNKKKNNAYMWEFLCDCGNKVELHVSAVRGDQKSCGCLKKEMKPNLTHGLSSSRTYRIWQNMKSRCTNENNSAADHYLLRGIRICDKWLDSFEAFLEDMGECPQKGTIERINNNGDYEPGNCRWATQQEQLRNTRRTIKVKINEGELCLKDACRILGVNYGCVISRIRSGIDPQEAIYGNYIF